jgi:hypothetical protein
MTHMDDQVTKHIKEMILKIKRKRTDNQERPRKPEPLDQIVRILRSPPNSCYDLRATHKISIDIKAGRVGSVSKEDLESPILTA